MYLAKLIAVNWGLLTPREFHFSQAVLLSGANAAGKTTLMDAMQSVMSGTLHGVLSYNRAQGEASQTARDGKTKRTVASYIVGQDDSWRRHARGATGYVALVFQPSPGETAPVFTALMGARVEIGGDVPRMECLRLWLVEGELALADCCTFTEGGYEVPAIDQMSARLRERYGIDAVQRFDDSKKDYLCHLYAWLQGARVPLPAEEAVRAGRTWCSLIGLKGELGNIHQLVRDQLLTAPEMGEELARIKDMLRLARDTRQDFDRMHADLQSLESLEQALHAEMAAIADLMRAQLGEEETRLQQQLQLQGRLQEERRDRLVDLTNAQAGRAEAEIELVRCTGEAQTAEEAYRLAAEDNGEARLQERLQQADTVLATLQQGLQNSAQVFSRASVLAQVAEAPLPALKPIWPALSRAATACSEALASWVAQPLSSPEAWQGAAAKIQALLRGGEGLAEVQALQFEAQTELTALNRQLADQKEELAHARAATGGLPREIARLKAAIEARFPTAQPRVVAEVAEVLDASWQPVIEAVLGTNAYAVLVGEREESAVARFVTEELGADIPVIQGTKLAGRRLEVLTGSVMDEVVADDPIIERFLANKLGRTMKANSLDELKHLNQGVTRDGFRVGGDAYRKRFTLNHAPIFGAHASGARIASVLARIDTLEARQQVLQDKVQRARDTVTLLAPMAQNDLPVVDGYTAAVDQRAQLAEALAAARSAEQQQALLALRQTALAAKDVAYQQLRQADMEVGRAQSEMELLAARLSGVAEHCAQLANAVDEHKAGWMLALDRSPVFDPLVWIAQSPAGDRWDVARGERLLAQRHGALEHALRDYNAQAAQLLVTPAQTTESGLADLPRLVAIGENLAGRLTQLREFDLQQLAARVQAHEQSFNATFTATFCDRVLNQADGCKRELEAMNQSLRKLVCMGESFTIEWTRDPIQAPYLGLFEALRQINDAQELASLFTAPGLSDEHKALAGKIVKLLLTADDLTADRELKLLADARNYYRFDIIRKTASGHTDKLSTWGTGSGGQLATPVTVLRAAVLASAVKLFDSRKPAHLRMLAMDEAFDKLDGPRTQALMHFLSEQLGLQVFCAMPTKDVPMIRASFGMEYEFIKSAFTAGDQKAYHTEVRFTEFNQAKMRQLEAAHIAEVANQAQQIFQQQA